MREAERHGGREVPRFDRNFFGSDEILSRIGGGELGGKARGLVRAHVQLSESTVSEPFGPYEVRVPRSVFLGTNVFDAFVLRNDLSRFATSGEPDPVVARAFQKASLPTEVLGDLRSLVDGMNVPLAVRSSSLLEDALFRPFAGVYETKMTPNNQADSDERFRRFVEAVKLVYASTFFRAARDYAQAVGQSTENEKMGVVVQEVVGNRRHDRFYPVLSAVARSYDFYASETASPEDGIISLALGLGKTIVDGGACWNYSPASPKSPPPYGSNRELLKHTQTRFWAVNMGRPAAFDPLNDTEYLVEGTLADAEFDGTVSDVCSTYDPASDRLSVGAGRPGARVLDFAPLLRIGDAPFNLAVRELLRICRRAEDADVEIEMAADWGLGRERPLLSLVQMRPMVGAAPEATLSPLQLADEHTLLSSQRAVGSGFELVEDVVYVVPDSFDPGSTVAIAEEVGRINAPLFGSGRPYLLIGFGRWGTTDPWGGIPVRWDQIGGARAIVEISRPDFRAAPSQGSHFFHNVTSLQVLYLGLDEEEGTRVRWDWLAESPEVERTAHLRHVRFPSGLRVEVDGRGRRGRVQRQAGDGTETVGREPRG